MVSLLLFVIIAGSTIIEKNCIQHSDEFIFVDRPPFHRKHQANQYLQFSYINRGTMRIIISCMVTN